MKVQRSKIFLTIALTAIVVLTAVFAFSSCSEEHVHTFKKVVVTEATCTEAGKTNKECTECDYSESLVVPATGHEKTNVPEKESTCTSVGYIEHVKCKKCDWTTLTKDGIKDRLDHDTVLVDDRQKKSPEYDLKYPTCTESGYHFEYYECEDCKANFDPVKVIDAPLGHGGFDHVLGSKDAKAASCTIGWDAFEYCDGWSTADLKKAGYPYMPAIASSGPVPGKGCGYNTYVEHPAIYPHVMSTEQKYIETEAPTCASEGAYKTVLECVTCSFVSLPDGSKANYNWNPNYKPGEDITGTGTIPKLDHEWQTHGEKIPDNCYTDGWEEFNMCSKCSQITDKDGNSLDEIPAIPAGHKFDSDGCLIVCDRCGFIDLNAERGGHSVVVDVKWLVEPTCYKSGKYECTKRCAHPDCELIILSVETVEIEPHGHDIVKHPAKAPDCTSVGWNEFETCSRCGYSTFAEIEKKGHDFDTTNPIEVQTLNKTCVSDGYHKYYYVCNVCNAEDHHNDVLPAGHDRAHIEKVEATCDVPGHSAYEYCTACGILLSAKETYQPIGHAIQKVPAQNATCTNNGWHDYIKCTREGCGYSTVEANTITALGHNMRTVEVIKAATCTTEGTYKSTSSCTACGYVDAEASIYEITGPALGHNYLDTGHCERYSQCGERYSVGLAYVKNSDGTYTVAGMGVSNDHELIIPDEYNGAKVVAIAEKAFAEKYEITSVKIGKNVTEIGQMAFYYCKNIKTVTIGESVIKVGANAFRGCAAITKTYYTGSNWGAIDFTTWNENLTSKY